MKLRKILPLVAAVVLIATISVGTSLAYLSDADAESNVATVGNLKIELLEYERVDTETKDTEAIVQEFQNGKLLLPAVRKAQDFTYNTPGDATVDWTEIGKEGYTSPIWDPAKINNELDKMVFVKNSGNIGAYVRNYFAFEAGSYTTFDEFKSKIHLNLNETDWKWEWNPDIADIEGTKYFVATATYQTVLAAGSITEISLSQIALDSSATGEEVAAFGEEYKILVYTQAIQETGFENPEDALEEGFGKDVPIDGVVIDKGIDLKTALHYLNGDSQGTKITANVTNVIFDLNEKYPNIVSNYKGTLISAEQDARVMAYYVPNGSNYDIYVLADGTIYTPKDSTELFRYMTALTKVDTTNLDVSRTENMKNMFRDCSNLTTLDVSNWDLGNVNCTTSMFVYCGKLNGLDVSKWNVSNVTHMGSMFYGCSELTYVDVSNWDISNVTDTRAMFYHCTNLTELNLSGWDTGEVTNMSFMFCGCRELQHLDIGGWDVKKVTTFERFLSSDFMNIPMKLQSIDLSAWQTDSLENASWMFQACGNMTYANLHGWNLSQATDMAAMFEFCNNLKNVDVGGWTLGNDISELGVVFRNCQVLETVDLSSWSTASATSMKYMFENCYKLKTVYVGDGWNTDNVAYSEKMFNKCPLLVGGNGTIYDSTIIDVTYAHVDGGEENPGYFTYKGSANP